MIKQTDDMADMNYFSLLQAGPTVQEVREAVFPDEKGWAPMCSLYVEDLSSSLDIYGEFEYVYMGGFERSLNSVHAMQRTPMGKCPLECFVAANSYGVFRSGPELKRTADGYEYRRNSLVPTSDEVFTSNPICFDRNGRYDAETTRRRSNEGDFAITVEDLVRVVEKHGQKRQARERAAADDTRHLEIFPTSDGRISIHTTNDRWIEVDAISIENEGYHVVRKDGKFNFLDPEGNMLARQWLDRAGFFKDGVAQCKLGDEIFQIDKKGTVVRKTPQQETLEKSQAMKI